MILVLGLLAPIILTQLLSFSYLRLLFLYVCVYGMHTCISGGQGLTGCLPRSLFSVSHLNPEFTDLDSVFR